MSQPHFATKSGASAGDKALPDSLPRPCASETNASTIAPPVRLASLWSRIEPLSCASTKVGWTLLQIAYDTNSRSTDGARIPSEERSTVCSLPPPPPVSGLLMTVTFSRP